MYRLIQKNASSLRGKIDQARLEPRIAAVSAPCPKFPYTIALRSPTPSFGGNRTAFLIEGDFIYPPGMKSTGDRTKGTEAFVGELFPASSTRPNTRQVQDAL